MAFPNSSMKFSGHGMKAKKEVIRGEIFKDSQQIMRSKILMEGGNGQLIIPKKTREVKVATLVRFSLDFLGFPFFEQLVHRVATWEVFEIVVRSSSELISTSVIQTRKPKVASLSIVPRISAGFGSATQPLHVAIHRTPGVASLHHTELVHEKAGPWAGLLGRPVELQAGVRAQSRPVEIPRQHLVVHIPAHELILVFRHHALYSRFDGRFLLVWARQVLDP
ncbi:histidoine biosynethsis 5B [Striga asiatica]|uniref:Histidoine biosynethsis 5B n=1 Tax=Striga asiatica TaxID=4170 RepID=A0A5A7QAW8_STRAF|nr:histidoine biosynethsis 5B [Striga asiatica]